MGPILKHGTTPAIAMAQARFIIQCSFSSPLDPILKNETILRHRNIRSECWSSFDSIANWINEAGIRNKTNKCPADTQKFGPGRFSMMCCAICIACCMFWYLRCKLMKYECNNNYWLRSNICVYSDFPDRSKPQYPWCLKCFNHY